MKPKVIDIRERLESNPVRQELGKQQLISRLMALSERLDNPALAPEELALIRTEVRECQELLKKYTG